MALTIAGSSCSDGPIINVNFGTVSLPNGASITAPVGDNVMPITVNGAQCDGGTSANYLNKPCVSVQVCTTGTNTCQTINDVLLDTGSTGLRIFKSALSVSLTPVTIQSEQVAECYSYADGSANWGPVEVADVILGNEAPATVPVQVIDSTFSTPPTACSTAAATPVAQGWTAILGVNFNAADCGATCEKSSADSFYYVCTGSGGGSTCSQTNVSLSDQVQNPVSALALDNNGVILEFPSVPLGGLTSLTGYLVLGIGTESNNVPTSVQGYQADPASGMFAVSYNGQTSGGFVDSGSNALYFPLPTTLTDCGSTNVSYTGFFCPALTQTFTATNFSSTLNPQGTVSYNIGNFINLATSSNSVFSEIGGAPPTSIALLFDWGMPFFYGRNVYVGLEGTSSSVGSGSYWAF